MYNIKNLQVGWEIFETNYHVDLYDDGSTDSGLFELVIKPLESLISEVIVF